MPGRRVAQEKSQQTENWPPKVALAVDLVLFTVRNLGRRPELCVVLIKRSEDAHVGMRALPGGFVRENENLDEAAKRVAKVEAGVTENLELEQVAAVGTLDRDPRYRVVTITYVALIPSDRQELLASGGAAADPRWFPVSDLPPLAFDHTDLLNRALAHLRRNLLESGACFRLLPERFTLGELQRLCETVLGLADGQRLDRANFRRRLLREGRGVGRERGFAFLERAPGKRPGRPRPARLYRFVPEAFQRYITERRQRPLS
jgi:8-oxo-dGTP diphosphatase